MSVLIIQLRCIIIAYPIITSALIIAIRINPTMTGQTTLVAFFNAILQWIPTRIHTTTVIQITRPWFILRFVQRITRWANMKQHGIHVRLNTHVQQIQQFCLLCFHRVGGGHWPIYIGYCCQPCRTHLALRSGSH